MSKARARRRIIRWARHSARTDKLGALCISWGWVRNANRAPKDGAYRHVRIQARVRR